MAAKSNTDKEDKVEDYALQIGFIIIAFEHLDQALRENFYCRLSNLQEDKYLLNIAMHGHKVDTLIQNLRILLKNKLKKEFHDKCLEWKVLNAINKIKELRNNLIHGLWSYGVVNKLLDAHHVPKIMSFGRRPKDEPDKDLQIYFIELQTLQDAHLTIKWLIDTLASMLEVTAEKRLSSLIDMEEAAKYLSWVDNLEKKLLKIRRISIQY